MAGWRKGSDEVTCTLPREDGYCSETPMVKRQTPGGGASKYLEQSWPLWKLKVAGMP